MRQDQLAALQPEAHAALADLVAAVWERPPVAPDLLELARLRMATLTGAAAELALRYATTGWDGVDEAKVAVLPRWPTHPAFTPTERAVIGYAEELVIDPRSISDETWDQVLRHLDARAAVQLTMALTVLAEVQRLSRATVLEAGPVRWSATVHARVAAPAATPDRPEQP